jgi:hypothetical protein
MEATKETVIGSSRFQISRVDSETGSFLLFQLLASLRKVMKEDDENDEPNKQERPKPELSPEDQVKQTEDAVSAMIQSMLMNVDRVMFGKIQRDALSVCGQFTAVGETETILPVLMANGKIAIPSLKTDIQTTVALTQQSLHFNLLPFFLSGGFKAATN